MFEFRSSKQNVDAVWMQTLDAIRTRSPWFKAAIKTHKTMIAFN